MLDLFFSLVTHGLVMMENKERARCFLGSTWGHPTLPWIPDRWSHSVSCRQCKSSLASLKLTHKLRVTESSSRYTALMSITSLRFTGPVLLSYHPTNLWETSLEDTRSLLCKLLDVWCHVLVGVYLSMLSVSSASRVLHEWIVAPNVSFPFRICLHTIHS